MQTRREWLAAATALWVAATAQNAAAVDLTEVVAKLTALTDDSYVNPRFNGPHFVYDGTYEAAKRFTEVKSSVGENNLGVMRILGKGAYEAALHVAIGAAPRRTWKQPGTISRSPTATNACPKRPRRKCCLRLS